MARGFNQGAGMKVSQSMAYALLTFAILGCACNKPAGTGNANSNSNSAVSNTNANSPAPSANGNSNSAPASTPSSIKVSATALFKTYSDNEAAGDKLYKGKLLTVTGTIDSADKTVNNQRYVTFGTGDAYSILRVECFFTEEHKSEWAQLKKGQQITLTGKCIGKPFNIILEDCVVK
jgi:hypothetical protein